MIPYQEQLAIPANARLCWYCQKRPGRTKDHIIPVGRGGAKRAENLVKACGRCNSLKHEFLLEEFLEVLQEKRKLGKYQEVIETMIERVKLLIIYATKNRAIMMTERHPNRMKPMYVGINIYEYQNPLA